MIIIMSDDQLDSKTRVAAAYNEKVVRFSPALAIEFKQLARDECLSFSGHCDTQGDKVMYFGGEGDSLSDAGYSSFFQGYTPQQFVDKLISFGLPKKIGIIELWSCGVGDTSPDGSFCYAREVAKLLAQKDYFPTVRATSALNLKAQATEADPLTGQSLLVLHQDTGKWSISALPTSATTSEKYQRCRETIQNAAKQLEIEGEQFMRLRATLSSEDENLTLTFPEVEKKLGQLRATIKDKSDYDFLDLESLENKYENLIYFIEEIENASIRQNESNLKKHEINLQKEISLLTANNTITDTYIQKALATLEKRKVVINNFTTLINLDYLAKKMKSSSFENNEPLSYFLEKKLEEHKENFSELSRVINYANASRVGLHKTIEQFADIRQYLATNAACDFSVKPSATHSPKMFQPIIAEPKDSIKVENPLYRQKLR